MKSCDEMVNRLFERREEYAASKKRRRKRLARMASSLCCLCLAAFMGVWIWQSGIPEASKAVQENDANTTNTANNTNNTNNTDNTDNNGMISSFSDNGDGEDLPSPAQTEYAVYTDSVELPEGAGDVAADMIGCLVYKGKVYTQSTAFYSYDSSIAGQLVGEYVGEAKGVLDVWSAREEWATEFASTYSGPVYKVNGYSEDFRLCIYVNAGNESWLQFLDNYDGIGLNTGADLFEERLHITGNVERITYLTHYDWNEGDPTARYHLTGVTEEQWEDFLTLLCSSPFERIAYSDNPDFYQAEIQGHLYLHMKDGTLVELRLIEGGYVGCQGLRWIFVKMPGEIFDAVLAACQ